MTVKCPECGAPCVPVIHLNLEPGYKYMSAILQTAAEVTGLTQQAVEKLHELTTYQLSSAASIRHEKAHA